ncbi:ABC transporter permease [Haematomicrobium sanguinis]|uniref:ABC transporter permease n=1 Tax=Haematomicrobium sanguinis TaxID=479106 RepID=UPI00047E6240|nr:ABC transporter permease [Haematomicrobium sanguinis]
MIKYLAKRIVTYSVMVFIVTSVTYLITVTTFKPWLLDENKNPRPSPEQIENRFRLLGLDFTKNPFERYLDWITGVITRWDWGRTPLGGSVNMEFGDRVWVSTRLYVAAIILTMVIGIALGVYSAARQYKWQDRVITSYSYISYILPAVIGYFLIQLLFIAINQALGSTVFFVTGISTPGVQPGWPAFWDGVAHYFVPTFAITILGWWNYQIAQRQYLLDNVNADFVRTARAKGLTRTQAIRKHALRVSFIPVAQSIAFTIPAIFAGGYFAEIIFAWPGIGQWSIAAISQGDVNSATATVAFGAVIFAFGAILADLATSLVDPRVRVQ